MNENELAEIIKEYFFEPFGVGGTKWIRVVENTKCFDGTVLIHRLSDKETVRLSVSNDYEPSLVEMVDLFETQHPNVVKQFLDLLI